MERIFFLVNRHEFGCLDRSKSAYQWMSRSSEIGLKRIHHVPAGFISQAVQDICDASPKSFNVPFSPHVCSDSTVDRHCVQLLFGIC